MNDKKKLDFDWTEHDDETSYAPYCEEEAFDHIVLVRLKEEGRRPVYGIASLAGRDQFGQQLFEANYYDDHGRKMGGQWRHGHNLLAVVTKWHSERANAIKIIEREHLLM